jgi:hypothetical protein
VKLSRYISGFIYSQGNTGLQQGRKAVSLVSFIYAEFSYSVQNSNNGSAPNRSARLIPITQDV